VAGKFETPIVQEPDCAAVHAPDCVTACVAGKFVTDEDHAPDCDTAAVHAPDCVTACVAGKFVTDEDHAPD
jgi:hypothetical protein